MCAFHYDCGRYDTQVGIAAYDLFFCQGVMLRCMSPVMAHRDALHRRMIPVANGE